MLRDGFGKCGTYSVMGFGGYHHIKESETISRWIRRDDGLLWPEHWLKGFDTGGEAADWLFDQRLECDYCHQRSDYARRPQRTPEIVCCVDSECIEKFLAATAA